MPVKVPLGLQVFKTIGSNVLQLTPAFRAGALSACFLILNYASRELLDVDPEEFDVLEPRVKRTSGGLAMPMMQIADSLVNGSGLSNRLMQPDKGGDPMILQVMRAILAGGAGSPLLELLGDEHPSKCMTGCYRCLHRYGNQGYHGLLDWRLGLDVIQLLIEPTYVAGLDGDFSASGVMHWHQMATTLADEAARLLSTNHKSVAGLPLIGLGNDKWGVVVHPLWDWDSVIASRPELESFALEFEVKPITTFELSRRMGKALLDIRGL